jgi:hypothetical protein
MIALRLMLVMTPLLAAAWNVADDLYKQNTPMLIYEAWMAFWVTAVLECVSVPFAILIVAIARGVAFGDIANRLISGVTQLGQPASPPPSAYGTTKPPANEHVRSRR